MKYIINDDQLSELKAVYLNLSYMIDGCDYNEEEYHYTQEEILGNLKINMETIDEIITECENNHIPQSLLPAPDYEIVQLL
jgi:putative IMPACT (imprinted ancient) family translation regulator